MNFDNPIKIGNKFEMSGIESTSTETVEEVEKVAESSPVKSEGKSQSKGLNLRKLGKKKTSYV